MRRDPLTPTLRSIKMLRDMENMINFHNTKHRTGNPKEAREETMEQVTVGLNTEKTVDVNPAGNMRREKATRQDKT